MGNLYSRTGYIQVPGSDPSAGDKSRNVEHRLTYLETSLDEVDDRLAVVENLKTIRQQMAQESMELRRNIEMPMGTFRRASWEKPAKVIHRAAPGFSYPRIPDGLVADVDSQSRSEKIHGRDRRTAKIYRDTCQKFHRGTSISIFACRHLRDADVSA